MKAFDWRQLIEEVKTYNRLQCELKTYEKEESEAGQIISYMEGIHTLCIDPQYQLIYNSYMSLPAEITEENKEQLIKDLAEKKDEFETVQASRERKENEVDMAFSRIIYNNLYYVMDRDKDYCPTELVTRENLPFLKALNDIAYYYVYLMYRVGGNVIEDLSRKIKAFEAKEEA